MPGPRRFVRSFESPDESIAQDTFRSETVSIGGLTIGHDVHEPGWRWSTHVKPLVGGEWCQTRHLGVILHGRLSVELEDGTTFEGGPLEVLDIPPGHDAWVVGDERLEVINWAGSRSWLAPIAPQVDRVLTTIFLTDIVDSTGTARRLGDRAWTDVLGTLESVTRDLLTSYRGRVIKMTGDGVLATFDAPVRALRSASALRGAIKEAGISIRAAIHTGEIELSDGDIHGIVVHEAARMLTRAKPDEILVSASTAGLVSGSEFALDDRGEHDLRGIEGARRLYALR